MRRWMKRASGDDSFSSEFKESPSLSFDMQVPLRIISAGAIASRL
jgi:hypothetical protein